MSFLRSFNSPSDNNDNLRLKSAFPSMSSGKSTSQHALIATSDTQGLYCIDCQLSFRTSAEFKKHNLRHTRPHLCQEPKCRRGRNGFTTKNDLERHQAAVHHIKGPNHMLWKCWYLGCSGADKIWPRRDNFRAHISRMHGSHCVDEYCQKSEDWWAKQQVLVHDEKSMPSTFDSFVRHQATTHGVFTRPLLTQDFNTSEVHYTQPEEGKTGRSVPQQRHADDDGDIDLYEHPSSLDAPDVWSLSGDVVQLKSEAYIGPEDQTGNTGKPWDLWSMPEVRSAASHRFNDLPLSTANTKKPRRPTGLVSRLQARSAVNHIVNHNRDHKTLSEGRSRRQLTHLKQADPGTTTSLIGEPYQSPRLSFASKQSTGSLSEEEKSFMGIATGDTSSESHEKDVDEYEDLAASDPNIKFWASLLAVEFLRLYAQYLSIRGKGAGPSASSRVISDNLDSSALASAATHLTVPCGSKKRSKIATDLSEDEDDESDENRRPSPRKCKKESDNGEKKPLACPYAKYDGARYSERNMTEREYRNCSNCLLKGIPRLKQHLYRHHKRPNHHCPRCYQTFGDEHEVVHHLRQTIVFQQLPVRYTEKMSPQQAEQIKKRAKGADDHEVWRRIFRILFPDRIEIPSPYADYDAPVVQAFVQVFRAIGPSAWFRVLTSAHSQGPQLPNLSASIQNILDEAAEIAWPGFLQVMDGYQTSTTRERATNQISAQTLIQGPFVMQNSFQQWELEGTQADVLPDLIQRSPTLAGATLPERMGGDLAASYHEPTSDALEGATPRGGQMIQEQFQEWSDLFTPH